MKTDDAPTTAKASIKIKGDPTLIPFGPGFRFTLADGRSLAVIGIRTSETGDVIVSCEPGEPPGPPPP